MAHTAALVNLETIVNDFLFGYKKPTEDYYLYLLHACHCYRDFRLYDSDQVVTEKVTVNANKWLDMPESMLTFVDLCIPISGAWWSFTERREIVNTTTFTGLVEGRDEDEGEGVELSTPRTTGYAARGGVNDYNYVLDWKARRIYIDGISDDTVVLMYTSSGIEVDGTTQVPDFVTPMIHDYLLLKETFWIPELTRERAIREDAYIKTRLNIRNLINGMSYSQWHDLLLGIAIQAPIR